MSTTVETHIPPQGSAPVYRRLLRSYGPLAVVALLLMLMAALIPTMPTEETPAEGTTDTGGENSLVVEVAPPVPAFHEVTV